eukprot:NODE_1515_length_1504_cov_132.882474_g1368_i0.p1 GENE.NODE_1515_length_1504_cov_132.882474_g1368_i0~~NODE_1515_length_1504_cov_132.882474_g1368_i0.p1  ORF type:complete len:469 (+),score=41.31 NODE_1515_length_1504_cov_132.882474_g1368_i0:79-1407(+)
MSALLSLSTAERLSDLVSKFDDEKGVYEFRLQRWDPSTKSFGPLYVTVDRRIPVIHRSGAPAYCYSEEPGELWPSLLEKAFAKAIKVWKAHPSSESGGSGYSCLDGGLSALALVHFLGGDAGCYWVREGSRWTSTQISNLAQLLADLFQKGVFLNINFKEVSSKVVGPRGETKGPKGLVAGHSYPVLRLEYFNVRGQVLRLVQLRTPWAETTRSTETEWQGEWSRNSDLWSRFPEAREICLKDMCPEGNPRGAFWMCVEDLAEYMDAFELCDPAEVSLRAPSVPVQVARNSPLYAEARAENPSPPRPRGSPEVLGNLHRKFAQSEAERRRLELVMELEREERARLESSVAALSQTTEILREDLLRRTYARPIPEPSIIVRRPVPLVGVAPRRTHSPTFATFAPSSLYSVPAPLYADRIIPFNDQRFTPGLEAAEILERPPLK